MARKDDVYEYLCSNFETNEPIFLSEIYISGMDSAVMRQQIKKLTEDGRLKRFDTGIYFLPKMSLFRSGSTLSVDEIIRKKYLMNGSDHCGYISGLRFANHIGITTQVASVYEIYTNKATKDYRETKIGNLKVILRKPYVMVDEQNVLILQFLDFLKEVLDISEIESDELTSCLVEYMRKTGIGFGDMSRFLPFYPERIYKNMYEVGLLKGVSV